MVVHPTTSPLWFTANWSLQEVLSITWQKKCLTYTIPLHHTQSVYWFDTAYQLSEDTVITFSHLALMRDILYCSTQAVSHRLIFWHHTVIVKSKLVLALVSMHSHMASQFFNPYNCFLSVPSPQWTLQCTPSILAWLLLCVINFDMLLPSRKLKKILASACSELLYLWLISRESFIIKNQL